MRYLVLSLPFLVLACFVGACTDDVNPGRDYIYGDQRAPSDSAGGDAMGGDTTGASDKGYEWDPAVETWTQLGTTATYHLVDSNLMTTVPK